MKGLIVFLLLLIVVALGYMILDKKQSEDRAQQASQERNQALAKTEQLHAEQVRAIAKAILERRIEIGMNRNQVRQAWGDDYSVGVAPPELNQFNIYQTLGFERGIVYLDLNGNVVRVKHN